MFSYTIYNNGKKVKDLPGWYDTLVEAFAAGETELDDLCPKSSPCRRFFRVEIVESRQVDPTCPFCEGTGSAYEGICVCAMPRRMK